MVPAHTGQGRIQNRCLSVVLDSVPEQCSDNSTETALCSLVDEVYTLRIKFYLMLSTSTIVAAKDPSLVSKVTPIDKWGPLVYVGIILHGASCSFLNDRTGPGNILFYFPVHPKQEIWERVGCSREEGDGGVWY